MMQRGNGTDWHRVALKIKQPQRSSADDDNRQDGSMRVIRILRQSKCNHLKWLFMRQILAIAVVAFSVANTASGQEQGAIRDPKSIAGQVIRKLDNERIQAQIHADAAALERIYADD